MKRSDGERGLESDARLLMDCEINEKRRPYHLSNKKQLKIIKYLAESGYVERFGFPNSLAFHLTPEGRRWVSRLPVV